MLIRNFLFHRISDEADPLWPPMGIGLFKKITSHLKKHYQVINLEHYLSDPNSFSRERRKLATIMFDDGFKDNIQYAAPVLDKLKLPASFYVVTGCIDKQIPTWTYNTDYLLRLTRKKVVSINGSDYHLNGMDQRLIIAGKLKYMMKAASYHERMHIYDSLIGQLNDVELPKDKMMNWDEVKQLAASGFSIGSHSVNHSPLSKIGSDDDLDFELRHSGEMIRQQLGFFPSTVSYPNGYCDQRVADHARQAGYKYGLAVRQEFFNPTLHNLMMIPRMELYNEPYLKVRVRMTGLIRLFRKKVYEKLQS